PWRGGAAETARGRRLGPRQPQPRCRGFGGCGARGAAAVDRERRFYPGLSIEALRLALGEKTIVALGDTRGDGTLESLRIGGLNVPTTPDGSLVLYDKLPDPREIISAAALLGDGYADLRGQIAGRIVLIGTSAAGLLDIHSTPLVPNLAGVRIHAEVIDQIAAQKFLTRADWVQGLEILVFIVAAVLLVLVVLRLGPIAGLILAVLLI